MININLFKKIHDRIIANPETFDMNDWESIHPCKTTRCVAGWAIFETTGQPLFRGDCDLDPSVTRLAESLEIDVCQTSSDLVVEVAANLLGLDENTARDLFHSEGYVAGDAVEALAHGREADARAILEDDPDPDEYAY